MVFAGVRFGAGYDKAEQQRAFFEQVLARVRRIPGVSAAAEASSIPALGGGAGSEVDVPGTTHPEGWGSRIEFCSEDFFRTLGLQLIRGRTLTPADINSVRHVVIVNQTLALTFFGKDDPIGRTIKFRAFDDLPDTPRNTYFEIVGVVSDYKNEGVRNTVAPQSFLPYTTSGLGNRVILASTSMNPASIMPDVNSAIWAVDRHVAMGTSGSIEHWLDRTDFSTPHFGTIFLGIFAAVGLALVAIGVFSVMLYTVSLQVHELGIRMALGAQPRHIFRLVLVKGLRLIALGMVAGLLTSAVATRFLSSLVWGISVTDSWTFITAAVIISAAGLAACFVPAKKATRLDPLNAMRSE